MEFIKISKTMEEYWKKIGYKPTDEQMATLIWNETEWNLNARLNILERFMKDVDRDSPFHTQVRTIKERASAMMDILRDNHSGEYIYHLNEWEPDDEEYEYSAYADSFEPLEETAKNKKAHFQITKLKKLQNASEYEDYSGASFQEGEGYAEYDNGKIKYVYAKGCSAEFVDEGIPFCNSYIGLPNPFKALDIVTAEVNGKRRIGIISPLYLKEEGGSASIPIKPDRAWKPDYSDEAITVEWLWDIKDKEFCHDHVNPLMLDFYELQDDDWEKEYIEAIRELFAGNDTLENVQMLFKGII